MLIIGAGGFARELLNVLLQNGITEIAFFDNVNKQIVSELFGYPILKDEYEVRTWFKETNCSEYCIGVGGPKNRKRLYHLMNSWGGNVFTTYSRSSDVGLVKNRIGVGSNISSGVIITSNVEIGKCCLINLNSTISHDCSIGDFVEISPGVTITGNCIVESEVTIGANATLIPKIKVGKNSIIAAGAVVTKDVPPNVMVAGVPAVIKKTFGNV